MNIKWKIYSFLLLVAVLINTQQFWVEQWLKFSLRNENIIIAFSTTPHRINNIQATVKSILEQNIKTKNIYLSIPYIFKRDNLEYIIPNWLQDNAKITILRTNDYGPATKLLGVLEQTSLPENSIIITLDDDIIYPHNTVLQLAYQAKTNPEAAVGISGVDLDYDRNGLVNTVNENGTLRRTVSGAKVAILQGFAGVAYKRKFFDNSIFNIIQAPAECIKSDDIYISYYLAKNNIPRIVLRNSYIDHLKINYEQPIGLANDALHKLSPKPAEKHKICVAYLQQQYPGVIF